MNTSTANQNVSAPLNVGIQTWMTGREYSEVGQRIAVVVLPSTGKVAFVDVDRGISGVTKNALPAYSDIPALKTFFMDEYDHGRYSGNFYDMPEIGSLEDISGFLVKMKIAAREQAKNESAILYGEPKRAFDPISPEGYALVMADPKLQRDWQDQLDSFFGERIVDVRNALRDAGWEGANRADKLDKGEVAVTFDALHVGAGRNVVGGVWKLLIIGGDAKWKTIGLITDDLTKTATEFAADIGETMEKAMVRMDENKLRQPQELTLAEFSEIAKVVELENHGRKWDVTFLGDSMGFADAATKAGALREAHAREVNNALYAHQPEAPDFLGKPVFPPAHVLAEYPEMEARFPEVFEARATLLETVHEGLFSGQVLEVADGRVTQKVSRDGRTVQHDQKVLSVPVAVGDVVEIKYSAGVGVVSGKEVAVGASLGR